MTSSSAQQQISRERHPRVPLVATYGRANLNRSELPMTETELKLIAAAATIGL
jgi:hypothetical protein